MTEQERKEVQKILDSIPDEIRVIENAINQDIIEEFYKISDQIVDKSLDNEETLSNKEKLVKLAETGDVKSYRKIEEIIQSNENLELNEFAYVALKFGRLNLENYLSDEPIGFISSGLGGKGNKLRYYFVIKSSENIDVEREMKIKGELQIICSYSYSELESIENFGNYVLIKILVSIEIAIGNVIEGLIDKCKFADKEYFCTNVERPTCELIESWMNGELE